MDDKKEIVDYNGAKFSINRWGIIRVLKEDGTDGDCLNYEDTVELICPDIDWFQLRLGSYQGSWYMLGKHKGNGHWYYKGGNYGSCSGCDWLEGVGTKEDLLEFLKEMGNIIDVSITRKNPLSYIMAEFDNWDKPSPGEIAELTKWYTEHGGKMPTQED